MSKIMISLIYNLIKNKNIPVYDELPARCGDSISLSTISRGYSYTQ